MMIIRGWPLILWARVGARGSDELLSHDSFTVSTPWWDTQHKEDGRRTDQPFHAALLCIRFWLRK